MKCFMQQLAKSKQKITANTQKNKTNAKRSIPQTSKKLSKVAKNKNETKL